MSKISDYLGLKAEQPQPAENSFSVPLIYSGVLLVFFAYLAVVQWPETGIPSQLHQLNSELEGGIYWVSDEGLSASTKFAAWAAFAWKFIFYLTLTGLLFRLSKTLQIKADFTQQVIKNLRIAQIVLVVGMLIYSVLVEITAQGIKTANGLDEIQREATFLSN